MPKKLRAQLNSCLAEGNGVHSWLFRTALRLHERFTQDEVVQILKTHLSLPCRRPEREMIEAVTNSGRVVRGELPHNRNRWPSVDYEMVHKIVVDCSIRLKDLKAVSPKNLRTEGPGRKIFWFGIPTNGTRRNRSNRSCFELSGSAWIKLLGQGASVSECLTECETMGFGNESSIWHRGFFTRKEVRNES